MLYQCHARYVILNIVAYSLVDEIVKQDLLRQINLACGISKFGLPRRIAESLHGWKPLLEFSDVKPPLENTEIHATKRHKNGVSFPVDLMREDTANTVLGRTLY